MRSSAFAVRTATDGSIVVRPHVTVGADRAVELQQMLVHTLRKVRPLRLILDLGDVFELDPINVGTLAAACELGDDQHVVVFLDNSPAHLAAQLTAAGVPHQRLRRVAGHG